MDAHTARHLFDKCIQGPLTAGRTVVLVSHHVQLCAPGASYVVSITTAVLWLMLTKYQIALDHGSLKYAGPQEGFPQHDAAAGMIKEQEPVSPVESRSSSMNEVETILEDETEYMTASQTTGTQQSQSTVTPKKAARKLYDEEKRAVGRIARDIWLMYIRACGSWLFWCTFVLIFVLTSISPIFNNGWLRCNQVDSLCPLWLIKIQYLVICPRCTHSSIEICWHLCLGIDLSHSAY